MIQTIFIIEHISQWHEQNKHSWPLNFLYSIFDQRMVTLQRKSSIFSYMFSNEQKLREGKFWREGYKDGQKTEQKSNFVFS